MAAFLPLLLGGVSALAGGLSNKPKTTTQKSSTTGNTTQDVNTNFNQSQDSSTAPVYDPQQLAMRNFLIQQFQNRLNPNTINNQVGSYIGQGVNNINQSANTNQQALSNVLASRGLSFSGSAGTALAGQESKRIGDVIGLRNQEPLLRDQLQRQNLTDFSTYMSSLPVGSHTTGTSSGTGYSQTLGSNHSETEGQNYDPGNPLGGALSAGASTLAYLYGKGSFGTSTKPKSSNYSQGNMNTSGGSDILN